jgi:hypothetical protein
MIKKEGGRPSHTGFPEALQTQAGIEPSLHPPVSRPYTLYHAGPRQEYITY